MRLHGKKSGTESTAGLEWCMKNRIFQAQAGKRKKGDEDVAPVLTNSGE